MTPQEIQSVYDSLSQVPQQAADQSIGEIGASQAAQGPSAAAMGASGGSGIGNYTYNRLVDPTVQQLRTQLVTEGRSQALNRALNLALQQAQERYRNASNTYANTPSGGGVVMNGTITGVDETVAPDRTPTGVTGLGPVYTEGGAKGVWDVGNDWAVIELDPNATTDQTLVPNILGKVTEADREAARKAEEQARAQANITNIVNKHVEQNNPFNNNPFNKNPSNAFIRR